MYQPDAEMLFPARVIPHLRDRRGKVWWGLVDRVTRQDETSVDALAFGLMMVRIGGCLTCHADSYRAMRGCTVCAQQAVTRYKGTDGELLKLFKAAKADVVNYLKTHSPPND